MSRLTSAYAKGPTVVLVDDVRAVKYRIAKDIYARETYNGFSPKLDSQGKDVLSGQGVVG